MCVETLAWEDVLSTPREYTKLDRSNVFCQYFHSTRCDVKYSKDLSVSGNTIINRNVHYEHITSQMSVQIQQSF
jgi:hypothetical protein